MVFFHVMMFIQMILAIVLIILITHNLKIMRNLDKRVKHLEIYKIHQKADVKAKFYRNPYSI